MYLLMQSGPLKQSGPICSPHVLKPLFVVPHRLDSDFVYPIPIYDRINIPLFEAFKWQVTHFNNEQLITKMHRERYAEINPID